MAYTSHGHQIPGTDVEEPRPRNVARCGGPRLCWECSRESAAVQSEVFGLKQQDNANIAYSPERGYQETARRLVLNYASEHMHRSDVEKGASLKFEDVYIVWFSKTLQNWKALVSTTLLDGMYYEVTCNGDKQEVYLDAYKKFDNRAYSFDALIDLG